MRAEAGNHWETLIRKTEKHARSANNFFNVYLLSRERERESMSSGGAEREAETEDQKRAPL